MLLSSLGHHYIDKWAWFQYVAANIPPIWAVSFFSDITHYDHEFCFKSEWKKEFKAKCRREKASSYKDMVSGGIVAVVGLMIVWCSFFILEMAPLQMKGRRLSLGYRASRDWTPT